MLDILQAVVLGLELLYWGLDGTLVDKLRQDDIISLIL